MCIRDSLSANTTLENESTHLEVARRTTDTLKNYIDLLGLAIEQEARVDDTLQIHEEIKNVSALIGELLQEFIYYEIQNAARLNKIMITAQNTILISDILLIVGFSAMMIKTMKKLIKGIQEPINELEGMAGRIAVGEFDTRVEGVQVMELRPLAKSLNVMAKRIKELILENNKEHEKLKKAELSLLQAQIKPHFLYNTYDTIIWLAEKNRKEDVIKVVEALTSFYRVALSKGDEWISVSNEIDHVESYLIIQQFRYGHILQYEIDVDAKISDIKVLKLVLQPLVENSIYHGIKYLRDRGMIRIRGYMEEGHIYFIIEDTGVGMSDKQLESIKNKMNQEKQEDIYDHHNGNQSGFGLCNVQQRLKLYYGTDCGMSIESQLGVGTTIKLKIGLSNRVLESGVKHV